MCRHAFAINRFFLYLLFSIFFLSSCDKKSGYTQKTSDRHVTDSAAFYHFIEKGDSAYAEKLNFISFSRAKGFYDSANALAEKNKDSVMIAEALFANGRVYDAWNKEPQKTIQFFTNAAEIMSRQPEKYIRSKYVKHLVAHAYDKIKDSINACRVLQEMYREINNESDSIKRKMNFIPEMALIATEVKNYQLAEKILSDLYKREWITNDPQTYNYLDHYFLTKSRIALSGGRTESPYYDSLEFITDKANIFDQMYYGREISALFEKTGKLKKALYYKKISADASETMNNAEGINSMQNKLLQSELENEKNKTLLDEKNLENRRIVTWGLSILLILISASLYGISKKSKQYKQQSVTLAGLNEDLGMKVGEISLLNKEIQHRIKNNLQTILSLLKMQERKTDNEEVIAELQQAGMRIESIATLHDQLNAGAVTKGIDFRKYVYDVANNIVLCVANNKQVVTHLDIGDIQISSEKNFSLALIFNEWITNSIKYAVPRKYLLTIYLSINPVNGKISIEYYDNGEVNLTPPEKKEGLGKEIITLLSAQLKGELLTKPQNPHHYTLTIPYE